MCHKACRLITILALLDPASDAIASDGTWNTTTSPAAWNLNTNWVSNTIADGSGSMADFSQVNPTTDTTVNLTVPRTIGQLSFGDTNTATPASWILAGSGTTLTLDAATPTITVNNLGTNQTTSITALLAGTNGFTKAGSGTLVLNNAGNSISGVIALSNGTLQYADAASLGTGSISFTGVSTLRAGAAATVTRAINITSGITATCDLASFNTTISGALTGSGTLTKAGSGELKLTGGVANTLTGPIMVNQGRLAIYDGYSHKNLSGAITVASGASFFYGQSFLGNNLNNNLNISGSGDGTYGALHLDFNAHIYGNITLAADATISHSWNDGVVHGTVTASNKNLTLVSNNAGQSPLIIEGNINLGTGSLIKSGLNKAEIKGNNTFGAVVVNDGALYFEDTAAFGVSGANIKVEANGVAVLYGSNIQPLIAKIQADSTGLVAFESSVTASSQAIDMSACPSLGFGAVGDMTYSGTMTAPGNYRFGGYNCTLTVSSPLTGANGLIISNSTTGTVVLTGLLSHTGGTVVKKGTLRMTGSLSGAITVESPGTLRLSPSTATGTIATSQTFVSNGTLSLRVNRGQTQKSDQITAASIALSGTLTVVNEGAALQAGDSFQLFSATGGITRSGLTLNLPTLSTGLSWNWNNLYTTGILMVATTGTISNVVGDPTHPELLFSEIKAVYLSGQSSVTINPGTYDMPRMNPWDSSFLIQYWHNFTINAENVLITLDQQRGFGIDQSSNITLKGCTIRARLVSFSQGKIIEKGKNPDGNLWAKWQISAGYPTNFIITDPDHGYSIPVYNVHSLNVVDQNTRYINQTADDSYSNLMTPLVNNTWKVDFNSSTRPFEVGDWLVTRANVYQTNAVRMSNSTNCTIDGVTSQGGSFATFYELGGGGNKLINCKIECTPVPPPGATELPLVSCAADGIHSRDSYPGLQIENFTSSGVLLDDIIAIHGFYSDITEVSGNTFKVYRISMLKAGDRVRIYNENGYFAEANCTSVVTEIPPSDTHPGTAWITIDATLPIPLGSRASNPKYDGAGYKIINCNLKGTRSRAIIAKADDGVISGNSISESQSAIRLGADYGGDESGWSWNTLIENNDIYNCRDAINMNADGVAIGNKNLTIRNNNFGATIRTSMYIAGTDGAIISGNHFGVTNLAELVEFQFSKNVSFTNNLVAYSPVGKPFIKGAANVTNLQGKDNGILFSGRAYALTNFLSNRLLANPLSNAVGETVQQYTDCNASGRWILQSNGAGYTKILSAANGLALGVNNNTSTGSSLVLENQGSGDGQLWILEPSGNTRVKLVNKLSGLHATVTSSDLGEPVKQNTSTSNDGQVWTPSFNDYTYATWRLGSGAGVNPNGDDDNDGLSNLAEYALATDLVPGGRATSGSVAPVIVNSVANDYLTLNLRRRVTATDVTLTVEHSNDLQTWTSSAVLVSSINNPDGTVSQVWRSPTHGAPKGFLRVRINPAN